MAASEGLMQNFCGILPYHIGSRAHINNYKSSVFLKSHRKCVPEQGLRCAQAVQCSSMQKVKFRLGGPSGGLHQTSTRRRSRSSIFCCESAESVKGSTPVDGNGTWYVDNAKGLHAIDTLVNGSNTLEDVQQLQGEKEVTVSNRNLVSAETEKDVRDKITVDPIEEEAWELLRESVVNYCGSPVGTIAASDPTSSDALNYDQVFIRDFIPSGVAFLLKGEYDIVRNFLLHTLQLQTVVGQFDDRRGEQLNFHRPICVDLMCGISSTFFGFTMIGYIFVVF